MIISENIKWVKRWKYIYILLMLHADALFWTMNTFLSFLAQRWMDSTVRFSSLYCATIPIYYFFFFSCAFHTHKSTYTNTAHIYSFHTNRVQHYSNFSYDDVRSGDHLLQTGMLMNWWPMQNIIRAHIYRVILQRRLECKLKYSGILECNNMLIIEVYLLWVKL